ncbi:chorismate mutase [Prochlorococcus sp. MIT 1223]|uniref:chorismate mutase n=1 Tax=Prochlorococcus sp. MIT 1223 TaxID=3096217 RepID=UPI002A74BE6B|nr:chorismate mutase [Prochlorococcus sp. MIT 1223]
MNNSETLVLQALRGAITCSKNSTESIANAVNELIDELVVRNNLKPEQIVSITFSVTRDLDACFPASIARKQPGWEKIALLDCQQMYVKSDLENCIRILAHTWLPSEQTPKHPYLGKATTLRPDR